MAQTITTYWGREIMEFPITVSKIEFEKDETLRPELLFGGSCGDMVSVRPCAEEYENKTFLGVLIGEVALGQGCRFNKETGELIIHRATHNPAIFIPDRNAVVYGCGSWWGKIKDEKQLREITDNDIQNVWYVKALNQIQNTPSPPTVGE